MLAGSLRLANFIDDLQQFLSRRFANVNNNI